MWIEAKNLLVNQSKSLITNLIHYEQNGLDGKSNEHIERELLCCSLSAPRDPFEFSLIKTLPLALFRALVIDLYPLP